MTTVAEDTAPVDIVDLDKAISYVAGKTARKYARWVEAEDVQQELHLYALTGGQRRLEGADADRAFRLLFAAARRYAEQEKAAKSGYRFSDLAWYSPGKIAELIPLALDPSFDGTTTDGEDGGGRGQGPAGEGGNLVVMVLDVRRAAAKVGWDEERISEFLGGEFPSAPGYRRRAMSNAAAQALTRGQEDEGVSYGRDN